MLEKNNQGTTTLQPPTHQKRPFKVQTMKVFQRLHKQGEKMQQFGSTKQTSKAIKMNITNAFLWYFKFYF